MRVEMGQTGNGDPSNRGHHPGPEHFGEARDGSDSAVEQKRGECTNAYCEQRRRHHDPAQLQWSNQREVQAPRTGCPDGLEAWPEKRRILREADGPRGDGKRSAERQLPDEEKRNEAAQGLWPVNLLQICLLYTSRLR